MKEFETYSKLAIATAKTSRLSEDLIHAALGLTSEAGEIATSIKAYIVYGKPLDVENLEEELGDILWFINYMCETIGTNLESVASGNIEKLRRRYPDGIFEAEKALRRLDKAEGEPSSLAFDPEDWMV